jgi:ABC-2 type transport system ATP-binding protein
MIAVGHLRKHYQVHPRVAGPWAAIRSLFNRPSETVNAVDDVSFTIAPGERVGLLGSNGAGKTTTLKVLSGLLHATSGSVEVAGYDPRRRDPAFLRRITLVLGQRQRLLWDLPPAETFELHRRVYEIPSLAFSETVRELSDLLELGELPSRPTRELSLGERMKCELAAALLHRPQVVFLDEPTIGLDVAMQAAVRSFVRRYNQKGGSTIILTSHYMEDVVALCPRVIVLNRGQVLYDGSLEALARRMRPEKQVVLRLEQPVADGDLLELGAIVRNVQLEAVLRVDPAQIKTVLAEALRRLPIRDLTVEDPPLEEVMAELYASAARDRGRPA